jgi:DNA-binding transcriptional regulator of glucitol operon
MRMLSIILFVFSSLGFVASAWLWWRRRNLPYNEEGRYFDGLVVYEEQGVSAYLVLAVIFFLTSLLVGYWAWRRLRPVKDTASTIEDFE